MWDGGRSPGLAVGVDACRIRRRRWQSLDLRSFRVVARRFAVRLNSAEMA
jgi:hypothetical protein